MIQNKKGLSDIVTTALIILLVAVAVAAIWAFVSPALRGTGIQFTKTQVCISNVIESITCKSGTASAGISGTSGGTTSVPKWYKDVQVRRTLTDGVAVPQTILVTIDGKSGTSPNDVTYANNDYFYAAGYAATGTALTKKDTESNLNMQQGALITVKPANYTANTGITEPTSQASQTKVTTTYRLPDNTIVVCSSLPITCD